METSLSFELLYSSDNNQALGLFLVWANGFLEGYDGPDCKIDLEKAHEFVTNLREDDFPANGGFQSASPFKKAANIYVWLHALNPFGTSLDQSSGGSVLSLHKHAIGTMIGYSIAKDCLHNAVLKRRDEQTIILKNPIEVSDHFFGDLVEASKEITPMSHYKTYSILFESLAYQANPGASYHDNRI